MRETKLQYRISWCQAAYILLGFRNFVLVITEMIGRLLGMWVPRNTANARLELHLWQTAGVVLVTAYSSSLAVRLASWEYEDR